MGDGIMPAIGYAIAVIGVLGALLFWQTKNIGKLSEQLQTQQAELRNAKHTTESLIEASKQHNAELARAREQAVKRASAVAKLSNDGCLDRTIPAGALDAIRVRGADEDGGAAAPSGSAAKAAPKFPR